MIPIHPYRPAVAAAPDLDALLVEDQASGDHRLHRSAFTDEALFELEMKHIFEGNWIYLAHESQIANNNDYYTTHIGRQPVFIARNRQGELNAFINACSHRGAQLCRHKRGNKATYTCPFHGWTFNNSGKLLKVKDPESAGYPECFNKEVYDFLFREKDPFCFEQLRLIRSVGESQELNKMNGQAIIISASGMCEAGRILHHLANNIGNPKNTVLFVGYCAEHTLGRKIMDGWKEVPILGKQYTVRARIREMDSFSGHADHGELLEYFDKTGGPKRNIILAHGEEKASLALAEALRARQPNPVSIAQLGSAMVL